MAKLNPGDRYWCAVCGKLLDYEYWLIDGIPYCKEHMQESCVIAYPRDDFPDIIHVWSIPNGQ